MPDRGPFSHTGAVRHVCLVVFVLASISLAAQTPGTPVLVSPANGAQTLSLPVTVRCTASNATAFDVRLGTSNPPPTTAVVSALQTCQYTPALQTGTTYFWQVLARTRSKSKLGPVWTFATAPDPPPPPPPPTYTAMTLAWDAPVGVAVQAYELGWGTTPGLYDQLVDAGLSTQVQITSLIAGTTYVFAVRDFDGVLWSTWSNEVTNHPPPASMAITHLANNAGAPATDNPATTAINTTGATLLVAIVHVGFNTGTFGDSASNSWTEVTATDTSGAIVRVFYVLAPVTSATHTATYTGGSVFGSVCLIAFAGTATSSALDQQATNAGDPVSTLQGGSVTPTQANEVVVSLSAQNANASSIDGGFTLGGHSAGSGSGPGCGVAYLIQTTATAANPTWTYTASDYAGVTNLTFKAPAASTDTMEWMNRTPVLRPRPMGGNVGY